ncbi:MAG: LptF/LptG family permease [Flavobacteriales bacterium]|nr:LptF/LptG family permease [Flavobacteriales bacterium]
MRRVFKRLHYLVISAYLGPLIMTFIIVLFILSMQFLWKYVDDLMGKGLPWYTLTELMLYATASFVPLALPLGILLSSIMTLGALGENSELIPMRSAGLHLMQILAPLMVLITLLAAGSFFFSNNVLPVANLKFHSLLWDVTKKKPALNLKPGVFYNGIDGFSIRVKEKDADTGALTDVLIYDHRDPLHGDRTVVRARSGSMSRSTDGRYLLLTLHDGHVYDQRDPADPKDKGMAMIRGTFETDVIRLDLSGLGLDRTDEELFQDHYKMLTLGQLDHTLDSLTEHAAARRAEQREYLHRGLRILGDSAQGLRTRAQLEPIPATLGPSQRADLYDAAMNKAREQVRFLERMHDEDRQRSSLLARFKVEWHRKIMLAFACIIFLFIGAPLGAIIRKGGMGMPTVFAILFFLVFHVISFSAEKLVISGKLEAWPGMWISSAVLLPLGAFLTWKAATDSPILDRDAYHRGWDKLRKLFAPSRHADPATM